MADEEKKVSFGFSKIIKKSTLQIPLKQEQKKVDYIECLDKKAIRIVGQQDVQHDVLVIPMLGSRSWHDRIINKTDANVFGPDVKPKRNEKNLAILDKVEIKNASQIKKEVLDPSENVSTSLEQQAACEIIQDLTKQEIKVEDSTLVVPIYQDEPSNDKQESTLEDYEQIPVSSFGYAALRGMGWKPGQGIGKNEKPIAVALPELRPRGMGLGADKANRGNQEITANTKMEERLKVEKGSLVKFIAGKWKSNYGRIEGFDDGAGRLIVKMALSGDSLSVNENIIEPVTKAEFAKNSKLLNNEKFEEYTKRMQGDSTNSGNVAKSGSESSEQRKMENNHSRVEKKKKRKKERSGSSLKKCKKMKKQSKYSSSENSDTDDRWNKRKSSSETDEEYGQNKVKKRKKSERKRDSSGERMKKKNKKKHNGMEQTECLDRRRHKKSHKTMRSRSSDRR